MKKHMLSSAIASLVLVANSMGAVTISLTGSPISGPSFFEGSTGTMFVPDGALIRIGTFANPPDPDTTFVDLLGSFHEFSRTTMGNTNPAAANTGHVVRNNIAGGNGPDSPDPDSYFIGKNVYIWVHGDVDGDSTGLEYQGVFSTALQYADQPTALSTSTIGYINAFGRNTASGARASVVLNAAHTLATRFNLVEVPEPSSAATLGLLTALGLACRRR